MRPDWMVCKNCLWLTENEASSRSGWCHHASHINIDNPMMFTWFCENWTCANCWKGWNHIKYLGNDMVYYPDGRPYRYIDHSKCKPVEFGGGNE